MTCFRILSVCYGETGKITKKTISKDSLHSDWD
jgi:hypothetical protein